MKTAEMFTTHPSPSPVDAGLLARTVEALLECAQTCTACADACLHEEQPAELRRCIRTDLDCADICAATARVLSRQGDPDPAVLRAQVQACVQACTSCAEQCEQHAGHHEHCRICAEACRACEQACTELLGALS